MVGDMHGGSNGKNPTHLLLECRRLTQEIDRGDRRLELHGILGVGGLWLSLYRDGRRLGLLGRLLGLNGGGLLLDRGRLCLRLWLWLR